MFYTTQYTLPASWVEQAEVCVPNEAEGPFLRQFQVRCWLGNGRRRTKKTDHDQGENGDDHFWIGLIPPATSLTLRLPKLYNSSHFLILFLYCPFVLPFVAQVQYLLHCLRSTPVRILRNTTIVCTILKNQPTTTRCLSTLGLGGCLCSRLFGQHRCAKGLCSWGMTRVGSFY